LILRKIIKIVATRCQTLRLKCTKLDFAWGSSPDSAGGAYSAPPGSIAGFKGPTSKGRRKEEGRGREVTGGERRGGKEGEGREKRRGKEGVGCGARRLAGARALPALAKDGPVDRPNYPVTLEI